MFTSISLWISFQDEIQPIRKLWVWYLVYFLRYHTGRRRKRRWTILLIVVPYIAPITNLGHPCIHSCDKSNIYYFGKLYQMDLLRGPNLDYSLVHYFVCWQGHHWKKMCCWILHHWKFCYSRRKLFIKLPSHSSKCLL